jgi:hypothetical protein
MNARAGHLVTRSAVAFVLTLVPVLSTGCAAHGVARDAVAPGSAPALQARQAEWTRARQLLSLLRLSQPVHPYVAELSVALRERVSGRGFGARGALAVDPHRALRLVLLGPGGATALDLWVTPTRYRLVVPSLDLVKRGGASSAGSAGLPVAFFRWWFLAPLDGKLLDAHLASDGAELFVRNDDGATVWLHDGAQRAAGSALLPRPSKPGLLAIRRAPGDADRSLEWSGSTLFPHPGDVVHYREEHPSFGIDVRVRIDALGQGAPDPAAFDDPDVIQPEVHL